MKSSLRLEQEQFANLNGHCERNDSVSLSDWHPGKMGLLWVAVAVALVVLLAAKAGHCTDATLAFWAVLSFPVAVATWRWFGYREKDRPAPDAESSFRDLLTEVLPAVVWLLWAGAVVLLWILWADCSIRSYPTGF